MRTTIVALFALVSIAACDDARRTIYAPSEGGSVDAAEGEGEGEGEPEVVGCYWRVRVCGDPPTGCWTASLWTDCPPDGAGAWQCMTPIQAAGETKRHTYDVLPEVLHLGDPSYYGMATYPDCKPVTVAVQHA